MDLPTPSMAGSAVISHDSRQKPLRGVPERFVKRDLHVDISDRGVKDARSPEVTSKINSTLVYRDKRFMIRKD